MFETTIMLLLAGFYTEKGSKLYYRQLALI